MQNLSSLKDLLKQLPPEIVKEEIANLSDAEAEQILYDWSLWARPNQLPPVGDWQTWIISAGRGWGKTKSGAECIRGLVESGNYSRIGLVGATASDVRDVIVEGDSGILSISPNYFRPKYESSKRRLTWPNGAIASTFSADEPERFRGPQYDAVWLDELASWKYQRESFDQIQFGLRLGQNPKQIITTTPRPTKLIKEIIANPKTIITRGSTYENKANLAPAFLEQIIKKYEGTRLGRQELNAEILDDNPNALWKYDQIDALRVYQAPITLSRIIVSIDPAVTNHEGSNETGIVVTAKADDGHGYVLADLTMSGSPEEWARAAVNAFHQYGADKIIGEVNNGGDMIESVIRTVDPYISYQSVRASRGKAVRAEPISALYEQGRIHHVGYFPKLEDQLCNFDPADYLESSARKRESPDRLDALVWGLTELFEKNSGLAYSIL